MTVDTCITTHRGR